MWIKKFITTNKLTLLVSIFVLVLSWLTYKQMTAIPQLRLFGDAERELTVTQVNGNPHVTGHRIQMELSNVGDVTAHNIVITAWTFWLPDILVRTDPKVAFTQEIQEHTLHIKLPVLGPHEKIIFFIKEFRNESWDKKEDPLAKIPKRPDIDPFPFNVRVTCEEGQKTSAIIPLVKAITLSEYEVSEFSYSGPEYGGTDHLMAPAR